MGIKIKKLDHVALFLAEPPLDLAVMINIRE